MLGRDTDQQHWAQVQPELLLLLRYLSRAMGSHGGILSRGGTGRHKFEGLRDCPPESCHLPLPSTESVLRTDSPSKIVKLDTVRVIAEKVSRALLWVPFHGS